MRIITNIKPTMSVEQIKPPNMNWVDIKTPHYGIVGAGMPIGLLLALTYSTSQTFIVDSGSPTRLLGAGMPTGLLLAITNNQDTTIVV